MIYDQIALYEGIFISDKRTVLMGGEVTARMTSLFETLILKGRQAEG
jgi:hypothetical protein